MHDACINHKEKPTWNRFFASLHFFTISYRLWNFSVFSPSQTVVSSVVRIFNMGEYIPSPNVAEEKYAIGYQITQRAPHHDSFKDLWETKWKKPVRSLAIETSTAH